MLEQRCASNIGRRPARQKSDYVPAVVYRYRVPFGIHPTYISLHRDIGTYANRALTFKSHRGSVPHVFSARERGGEEKEKTRQREGERRDGDGRVENEMGKGVANEGIPRVTRYTAVVIFLRPLKRNT